MPRPMTPTSCCSLHPSRSPRISLVFKPRVNPSRFSLTSWSRVLRVRQRRLQGS
ncbi:hypothetical protein BC831DRAFT_445897 [Entophlyctis helioformis]|nr:hypothetical protein BC831DRAFT_445897 [Entophlyctis helioformis]